MIIGIPREIKDREYRVGIVPAGVRSFVASGHTVIIEQQAGSGSGITDDAYQQAGAAVVETAADVYGRADLIMKVKEPQPSEYGLLRENQILFTYLHLAPLPDLTEILLEKKIIGIGYETVMLDKGYLPLLAPMSEVAGRMAPQVGARFLEKEMGGRGILLGGIPGVERGHVAIIGSGTVGRNAARIALGLGASVTVLGRNHRQLAELDAAFDGRINTLVSSPQTIEEEIAKADIVVGAVLIPGMSAPKLITRPMLSLMKKGAVIVDVAIDQGGCVETSRPTTHSNPVFEVDGIIHYCVANMPGAVPRTATFALTSVTLPYALEIVDKGFQTAVQENIPLQRGVNVCTGRLTNREVAESQGKAWSALRFDR